MNEKYLSKQEAAAAFGVHERTITRYLHNGKLKGALIGKSWRIAESDFKDFYEQAKIETAKNIDKIKRRIGGDERGE